MVGLMVVISYRSIHLQVFQQFLHPIPSVRFGKESKVVLFEQFPKLVASAKVFYIMRDVFERLDNHNYVLLILV